MRFIGNIKEVLDGIKILHIKDMQDEEAAVSKSNDSIRICGKDGKYSIEYCEKADFFRAAAILKDKILKNEKNFELIFRRKFEQCGIMIDVSRNAVLKVETVKTIITYMANMGLNMLMLYTEDTYKLDRYPYFGYMRGAYTKDEIKEIVEYAEIFGIEVVPCIQTLAHLSRTLRWGYAKEIKDTDDILLIDEEKTYEFIEEMIKTVRECYKTDKIHIGMDEAHYVGLGTYLNKNGYVNRFELISRHLKRVVEITDKYDFKPMMWSDMFFRLGSDEGSYSDVNAKMPDNIEELIPKQVSLVYWDYYRLDENFYNKMLKIHKSMKRDIIFAGGVWTWSGLSLNYDTTFSTTKPALAACRNNDIKSVIATFWGDDGAECSIFEGLLGMQLYAEYNYFDEVTEKHLTDMFKICTGYDADAFLLFNIDDFGDECENHCALVSKQVFYSDPMLGLLDKNLEQLDLKSHYSDIMGRFKNISPQNGLEYLFDYQFALVTIIYKKCRLGIDITNAYISNDKNKLSTLAAKAMDIAQDIKALKKMAADIWFNNNKPFGFEYIDVKFGGVITRLESAAERIEGYLMGKYESLEELLEERLYYDGIESPFVTLGNSDRIQRT